ncbi:MAG: type II toxin-antitoxin system VapC family toxin [Vicinamibacteria bacterium]
MRALFDTNILVDYLNGIAKARSEIEIFPERAISVISWAETMVGARGQEEEGTIQGFLADFSVVEVDLEIAREAVSLRRGRRLRLPDALIWATARLQGAVLVTRNTKDFPKKDPGIRVPYVL